MENKVRFKLHKVKKNWVTIGVTTLSMVALAGGSLLAQGKVEADETSTPNGDGLQQLSEDGTASLVTTTTVTEQASAQASVSAVATASVSHETSSQVVISTVSQEATAQAQNSQVASQEVAVSSQTQETQTAEQVSQGQVTTQATVQERPQSTPRVLTNATPTIATRAADSTIRINANRNTNITITASGTTPNVTIITGPNSPKPNSPKPNVTVTSPNGTRPNVTIVTQPNQPNKPVQPSQPSQPNKPVQPSQPSLDYKPVATNLKTIDGKQYYVENGVVKKNTAIELDGRLYYFDETGAMVDQSKPLYRADAIPNNSINAVYNQAYDTSSKSFEQLDNFLTADSWYRPKQILKDGKNWTASTEKDYRPLLMTWWPDKVTQVNYLNYMSQQGFSDETYTTDMMS